MSDNRLSKKSKSKSDLTDENDKRESSAKSKPSKNEEAVETNNKKKLPEDDNESPKIKRNKSSSIEETNSTSDINIKEVIHLILFRFFAYILNLVVLKMTDPYS